MPAVCPIAGFREHRLWNEAALFVGRLPDALIPDAGGFERLWQAHPRWYHILSMRGRPVPAPRWQQAFARDYRYTGSTNAALPLPAELSPFLAWGQAAIHPTLNGVLVNWYDAALGHYIGRHRDSRAGLDPAVPIVTISLGEARVFRLRPWRPRGGAAPERIDFLAGDGAVFVMPSATNLVVTHEVPRARADAGRRISITLRGFAEAPPR